MVAVSWAAEPAFSAYVQSAADWVHAFYPDINVAIDGQACLLSSDARTASAITLIWDSALANERLFISNAAPRRAMIEMLIR